MTPSEVVDRVRGMVGDDVPLAEQVWKDDLYYKLLNESLRHMFTQYPSCRVATDGTLEDFSEASPNYPTATLWLDDFYMESLALLIASKFFMTEARDTRDKERSREFLAVFKMNMVGG